MGGSGCLRLDWKLAYASGLRISKTEYIVRATIGNTPLWSLSYEWWFYIIYFAIQKTTERATQDKEIFSIFIIATLISYVIYILHYPLKFTIDLFNEFATPPGKLLFILSSLYSVAYLIEIVVYPTVKMLF